VAFVAALNSRYIFLLSSSAIGLQAVRFLVFWPMTEGTMAATRGSQSRIFWGLIFIIVGALFLLDRLGQLDVGHIISRYWPAIFILIGISIIIANDFKSTGAGVFFILFGAFFLLMDMRIFDRPVWHYFWPLLIIGLGIWILLKPARAVDKKKIPELTVDELRISQVFSSTARRVESPNFKGGSAEVVFGSAEIDLTGAGLEGGQAALSLSTVFGSIELRVRPEWQVVIEGTPVLGSIEQKKRQPTDAEKRGTLLINASVVLGSIQIKD
jgi:predicted membrane protein